MQKNEIDVYSMSIRSGLNRLYVLSKTIVSTMENDSPDVRGVALLAACALTYTAEELFEKVNTLVEGIDHAESQNH